MKMSELSFENKIARLEEIIHLLENNTIDLTDSLKLYTEGSKLLFECREELKNAEQIIAKITCTENGPLETIISENDLN